MVEDQSATRSEMGRTLEYNSHSRPKARISRPGESSPQVAPHLFARSYEQTQPAPTRSARSGDCDTQVQWHSAASGDRSSIRFFG
jgi:hypothetical protein